MKQQFFWFVVCGMFFCLLGFLFAGLGVWVLIRTLDNPTAIQRFYEFVQPPVVFCAVLCVLMETIGSLFIFGGIRSLPKDTP